MSEWYLSEGEVVKVKEDREWNCAGALGQIVKIEEVEVGAGTEKLHTVKFRDNTTIDFNHVHLCKTSTAHIEFHDDYKFRRGDLVKCKRGVCRGETGRVVDFKKTNYDSVKQYAIKGIGAIPSELTWKIESQLEKVKR